jgi:hypothetical protein
MNIANVLDLKTEKQSAFEKMMLDGIQGANRVQASFKVAIEQIEKNTPYKKILTLVPFKISVVKLLSGDDKDHKVNGRYDPRKDEASLHQNPALRMLVVELIKHELAHHLVHTFMDPRNHDSHGHLIGPKGNNIYVKYEMVEDLFNAAQDEYQKEKSRVEKESGVKIGEDLDKHWEKLFETGTLAPSIYSLKTNHDWFAESMALYWSQSDEMEKFAKRFPATYNAIDLLLRGKVLDRVDE